MFSDWTDPFEIDNYYQDLDGLMKDIQVAPSSSMYYRSPQSTLKPVATEVKPPATTSQKPEAPVSQVVNTSPKSKFEVKPDSIFLDGHPVGHQPPFNILRSGPPKETYCDGATNGYCSGMDWFSIWLYVFIGFLCILLVAYRIKICALESQIRTSDMAVKMMIMLQNGLSQKGKPTS